MTPIPTSLPSSPFDPGEVLGDVVVSAAPAAPSGSSFFEQDNTTRLIINMPIINVLKKFKARGLFI